MGNEFLSTIAVVLAGAIQAARANPKFPEWAALVLVVVIGIGAYYLGSAAPDLASREWWMGAIQWVLSAAGVVQLLSTGANLAGVKALQTSKEG